MCEQDALSVVCRRRYSVRLGDKAREVGADLGQNIESLATL